jgi:hypothetical protein
MLILDWKYNIKVKLNVSIYLIKYIELSNDKSHNKLVKKHKLKVYTNSINLKNTII